MILLLHIGVALLSVAFAAYTFITPSKAKLQVSLWLVGGTLASGTYLVVMAPAHMLQACMAGVFYTGALLVMTALTQRKLNRATVAEEAVNNK